ncbi:MAG: hypothetical protein AAFQ74_01700, partial [Cyanobacteria bacterium J06623_4]
MAQDILIQAEDMGLSGDYTADFSKGYITLPGTTDDSSTGTAAAKFNGPDGTYDIIVSYFDEGDGKAQYQVDLNNSRIDAWTADLPGGASLPKPSNLTTRTISGISLKAGDTFSITGIENAGELGRVDAIQFVEAQSGGNQGGGSTEPPEPGTVPTMSGLSIEAEDMGLSGDYTADFSKG